MKYIIFWYNSGHSRLCRFDAPIDKGQTGHGPRWTDARLWENSIWRGNLQSKLHDGVGFDPWWAGSRVTGRLRMVLMAILRNLRSLKGERGVQFRFEWTWLWMMWWFEYRSFVIYKWKYLYFYKLIILKILYRYYEFHCLKKIRFHFSTLKGLFVSWQWFVNWKYRLCENLPHYTSLKVLIFISCQ